MSDVGRVSSPFGATKAVRLAIPAIMRKEDTPSKDSVLQLYSTFGNIANDFGKFSKFLFCFYFNCCPKFNITACFTNLTAWAYTSTCLILGDEGYV